MSRSIRLRHCVVPALALAIFAATLARVAYTTLAHHEVTPLTTVQQQMIVGGSVFFVCPGVRNYQCTGCSAYAPGACTLGYGGICWPPLNPAPGTGIAGCSATRNTWHCVFTGNPYESCQNNKSNSYSCGTAQTPDCAINTAGTACTSTPCVNGGLINCDTC